MRLNENPDTYDLKARYDYFNEKFWDGKLPNIKLEWKPLKRVAGEVRFSVSRSLNAVLQDTMVLILSTVFKREPEHLDSILLHEMIHVYFLSKNNWKENHGVYFEAERARVSRLWGKEVIRKDTIDDLELSDAAKDRKIGVFVIRYKKRDGSTQSSYFLVSEKMASTSKELRSYAAARVLRYSETVEVYVTNNPKWILKSATMKVARKFEKADRYLLKPEDDALLTKDDLIYEKKLDLNGGL